MTSPRGDTALKEQLPFRAVKNNVARSLSAEEPGLSAATIRVNGYSPHACGAAPETGMQPVRWSLFRLNEKNVCGDTVRIFAKQPVQFAESCPRAGAMRMCEQEQSSPMPV